MGEFTNFSYGYPLAVCTVKRSDSLRSNSSSMGLLRKLFGSTCAGANAVRFALPEADGRPTDFPEAIRWLAQRLHLREAGEKPLPHSNDGGADVIAWRPFPDQRNGHPVVLCQCTVQLDRWWNKAEDVKPDQWRSWITFDRPPLRGLAVPFTSSSNTSGWRRARWSADVLLDRIRLAELALASSVDDIDTIVSWSLAERAKVAAAAGD